MVPIGIAEAAGERAIAPGETQPLDVPALTTVLNSCNDGNPHAGPRGSSFTISPEGAGTYPGGTPTIEAMLSGTASTAVQASPGAVPGTIFIASWTAFADGCYSANGSVTFVVTAAAPPPPPPPPPPEPPQTPDPHSDELTECVSVLLSGGKTLRVFVQRRKEVIDSASAFSADCHLARAVAQGQRLPGVECSSPAGLPRGERFVTCTSNAVHVVIVPPGVSSKPVRCADVVEQGHRYAVFKLRVTCPYARSATLRMLRGIRPYVNEIVIHPGGRIRWHCRTWAPLPPGTLVAGAAATQRGFCRKDGPEARWILFFPAPRAR
jgi:hypothetical protein